MKNQFDALIKFEELTKESSTRIKEFQREIEKNLSKLKKEIIKSFDNTLETIYLIKFSAYHPTFYRATKEKVTEIILMYSNPPLSFPKSSIEGQTYIDTLGFSPTQCQVHSHMEFGYFHDIEKRYDREDWITENIYNKDYLFEITEKDWNKAITILNKYLHETV